MNRYVRYGLVGLACFAALIALVFLIPATPFILKVVGTLFCWVGMAIMWLGNTIHAWMLYCLTSYASWQSTPKKDGPKSDPVQQTAEVAKPDKTTAELLAKVDELQKRLDQATAARHTAKPESSVPPVIPTDCNGDKPCDGWDTPSVPPVIP